MASTFTNNLLLEKMGSGEQNGTWGDIFNLNLDAIDESYGHTKVTVSNGATTLAFVSTSTSPARHGVVEVIGTLTSAAHLVLPNVEKTYVIKNSTGSAFGFRVTVNGGSGPVVSVSSGKSLPIYTVGGGAYKTVQNLPPALGGTGTSVTTGLFTIFEVEATRTQVGTVRSSGANTGAGISTSNAALLPKSFNARRQIVVGTTLFVSAGTYVVSAPPNTQAFLFWLQGAGGAGGGCSAGSNELAAGGGGDSGAYVHGLTLFTGTTLSIVVGAGGTGVSAAPGNSGGLTEITGYISSSGGAGGVGQINNFSLVTVRWAVLGGETTVTWGWSTTAETNTTSFGLARNNFGERCWTWLESVGVSGGGTISGRGANPPSALGYGGQENIAVGAVTVAVTGQSGYFGGGGSGAISSRENISLPGGRGGDGWVRIAWLTY